MKKTLLTKSIGSRIYITICFLLFLLHNPAKANVYYWVGGTGNWSQYNTHWATNSGGLIFHIQTPTPSDTVIFDANSFTANGQTVWVDSTFITCHDMKWVGVTNNPTFKNTSSNSNGAFNIYGSLTLSPNMIWNYGGTINMEATSGNQSITSASHNLGDFMFNGNAHWTLNDSLLANYIILPSGSGSFNSNNQTIHTGILSAYGTASFGTSNIYCSSFNANSTYSLDADSCIFWIEGSSSNFDGGSNRIYNKVFFLDFGNNLNATGSSFKLVSAGPLDANINSCTFDSLICSDLFNMSNGPNNGNNSFSYARFNNDVSLYGNNSFDTLFCNNPGHTITLQNGFTQTINNELLINASGGFPVTLQSDQAGTQATISKAADTVCVNYILMQDIKATGGAQFYAGQYSSNISNNTGWQWMSCSQAIGNVWPGDANYDLITNNLDVIYIGLAYNQTGFVRAGASNTYSAQPCFDWNTTFTNLANVNHADCDGNGVVNANDTIAVSLNYGLTNTGRMSAPQLQSTNSNTSIYFAPTQQTYLPGSWVSIPIDLGTSVNPATNIYGLAFTIQYDASQIQAGSISVSYNGSWLVSSNNIVHLEKDFYSNSYIDVGMARTNHANNSGNGTIAYLNFQVSSTATNGLINLSFANVTVMDVNQTIIPVTATSNSVAVGINAISPIENSVSVYPNPTTGIVNLEVRGTKGNYEARMTNVLGEEVIRTSNLVLPTSQIDVSNLQNGVYFISIKTTEGIVTKKITVQH